MSDDKTETVADRLDSLKAKSGQKDAEDKQKGEAADNSNLHVKIYSPFRVYYNGEASSISAVNETGPFDILPRHHQFITLLKAGEISVRLDDRSQVFKIERGIMHVKKNQIIVFLDI